MGVASGRDDSRPAWIAQEKSARISVAAACEFREKIDVGSAEAARATFAASAIRVP
jgi:hypothetical protein